MRIRWHQHLNSPHETLIPKWIICLTTQPITLNFYDWNHLPILQHSPTAVWYTLNKMEPVANHESTNSSFATWESPKRHFSWSYSCWNDSTWSFLSLKEKLKKNQKTTTSPTSQYSSDPSHLLVHLSSQCTLTHNTVNTTNKNITTRCHHISPTSPQNDFLKPESSFVALIIIPIL